MTSPGRPNGRGESGGLYNKVTETCDEVYTVTKQLITHSSVRRKLTELVAGDPVHIGLKGSTCKRIMARMSLGSDLQGAHAPPVVKKRGYGGTNALG